MKMELLNKSIDAKEYTLKEILNDKKYTCDYFQREYKWKKENVEQLVQDLTDAFRDNLRPNHTTEDVARYATYFLGSIVLSDKGGVLSIIDGQQRLTSLTLLLIYLNHEMYNQHIEDEANLKTMIFSNSFGRKSFNIQIPERELCLKALYEEGNYCPIETDDESTRVMAERYQDIYDCFPQDIKDSYLLPFTYWLQEKVVLVKITAMTEENAYTIFETMNNRGVPLTNADMIKGFILSKFTHEDKRSSVNLQWKKDMQNMAEYGDGVENQFFQAWLRAQFAQTIRQAKVGSLNEDFENIGNRFHNWFKDNYEKCIHGDMELFIDTNYRFFLKKFLLIKKAETTYIKELEHVFYHAYWGIAPSLSYPLYLAPLRLEDSDEDCIKKIELVARYLDSFATRRACNFRNFSASSIRYTMCNLTRQIRGLSIKELRKTLIDSTEEIDDFNKSLLSFRLHGMNGRFIKYFLARITSFIEEGSGLGNNYVKYMYNLGCKPYEIEHIWSDHFDWHQDEFSQTEEFSNWRNSIGDLLLLPNGVNQSLNDLNYNEKMPHYIKENLLAQSLCAQAYDHTPGFIGYYMSMNFQFCPYDEFKKDNIRSRCQLYAQIANVIWDKNLTVSD